MNGYIYTQYRDRIIDFTIDKQCREESMLTDMLIAFDSTQQALRAEMLLEYADIDIDTLPTPKEITAGCALSIGFHGQDLPQVKVLLETERVEIRGIFLKKGGVYVTIDEQEEA
jgi:hypothetical protein